MLSESPFKAPAISYTLISLMNEDSDFDKAISSSTGIPRHVKKRFSAIKKMVREMV